MANTNFINTQLANQGGSCLINGPQMEIRRREILEKLSSNTISKSLTEGGYVIEFPNENQLAHDLLDFILKEQNCCSFFEFNLKFNKKENRILLQITSDSVDDDVIQNIVEALL